MTYLQRLFFFCIEGLITLVILAFIISSPSILVFFLWKNYCVNFFDIVGWSALLSVVSIMASKYLVYMFRGLAEIDSFYYEKLKVYALVFSFANSLLFMFFCSLVITDILVGNMTGSNFLSFVVYIIFVVCFFAGFAASYMFFLKWFEDKKVRFSY